MSAATQPCCPLCFQDGSRLYVGLRDSHFGAPGAWNLVRCVDQRCALIWLDPMPSTDELGVAYLNYYTHAPSQNPHSSVGLARRFYRVIKQGYLEQRYGYRTPSSSWFKRLVGSLLPLLPPNRESADEEVRQLHALPGGRLLDVGCGSGDWLLRMQALGWKVTGMDFDPAAVAIAQGRGLDVRCGVLQDLAYPSNRFDVISLNHVIEHLHDPVAVLAECRRLLKPGGQLQVATPNSASLGHRVFKSGWRGLEPPRHLHLFCGEALTAALTQAGFTGLVVQTAGSEYLWRASLPVRFRRGRVAMAFALAMAESLWILCDPGAGECLTAKVIKK